MLRKLRVGRWCRCTLVPISWLSLLLLAATLAVLGRQCLNGDEFQFRSHHTEAECQSSLGAFCCSVEANLPVDASPELLHQCVAAPGDSTFWSDPWLTLAYHASPGQAIEGRLLGLHVGYAHGENGALEFCIQTPLWIPILLSLLAPALVFRRKHLPATSALRPCPNCGYDTRANHLRCSECGAPISSAAFHCS